MAAITKKARKKFASGEMGKGRQRRIEKKFGTAR